MAATGNYVVIPRNFAGYSTVISDCSVKHLSEAPGTNLSVFGLNDETVMIKIKNGDATWRDAQSWGASTIVNYTPSEVTERLSYYSTRSTFDPKSIGDLKLWLDYSDLSSGAVTTWADKSVNAKDAVQAVVLNKPTKDTDGVYFDGVARFLTSGSASNWTFLNNGINSTAFVVFKLDDRTGIQGLLTTIATTLGVGVGFGYYATDNAVYNIYNGDDPGYASNISDNNLFADTGFSVKGFYFNGTNAVIFDEDLNTSSVTTEGSPSSSAPETTLTIGGLAGAFFFKGWIKAIVVYSANLSVSDKQAIISYLEGAYSL